MYSLRTFRTIRKHLCETLLDHEGEPISCRLYEARDAHGVIALETESGGLETFHVAEACNIASVIASIDRILSLPRSNIACAELAEVLILRLDVLREYIRATTNGWPGTGYAETPADQTIRRWAGFLKHPSEFVFAHRCFATWGIDFDEPFVEINGDFLAEWDRLSSKARDAKKSELAHEMVEVVLPPLSLIVEFFEASGEHLRRLVGDM